MKRLLLLLWLSVNFVGSYAQTTIEVIWEPFLRDYQGSPYVGVNLLAEGRDQSFWHEVVESHVNGSLTLYPGLASDASPYPRRYRTFTHFFPDAANEMRDPWQPVEGDSLTYLEPTAYHPSWVIQERWTLGAQEPTCEFQALHLQWEDTYGALRTMHTRTSLNFETLPPTLFRLAPNLSTYTEELNLSELYAHRRLSIKPLAWRPAGESSWRSLSSGDSLLEATNYAALLPDSRQLEKWYPVRSKSPYFLYLHLPDEIGHEYARNLPFSAEEWEANRALIDGLLPRIIDDVMADRLLMQRTDSDSMMAAAEAKAKLTDHYRNLLQIEQFAEEKPKPSSAEKDPFEDPFAPVEPTPPAPQPEIELPEDYAVNNIRIVQIRGRLQVDHRERVTFEPEQMELIWRDPMDRYPQMVWGHLPVEALAAAGYTIQGQPLSEWLAERAYAAYPLNINGKGLQNMEEAWLFRQILESGKWELMPNHGSNSEAWEAFKANLPRGMLLGK